MSTISEEIQLSDGASISAYITKRSNARRIVMHVKSNKLHITVPKHVLKGEYRNFVKNNTGWIKKNILPTSELSDSVPNRIDYLEKKIQAKKLVKKSLERLNKHYGFEYDRITIRDQSSRWGSCSTNKTLSFNYRIVSLPEEIQDYIVVHELCHLAEMNHSFRFWNLVGQTIPNYKYLRKKLKSLEKDLF